MSTMPWFRVYSDILSDRKIKRICKRTGQSKALVIGVWICLLSLANEAPERGTLSIADDMPYTVEDIEDETGLPIEILGQLLDEFRSHGMLNGKTTLEISNWTKRQYKSDYSAERVARYRAKEKEKVKRYTNVVEEEESQNRGDIESDTESDTEAESDDNLSSEFGELEQAFIEASALPMFSGGTIKWLESFKAMKKAKAEPEDVTNAVATLLEKNYTVVGPGSIVNAVNFEISKKRGKRKSTAKEYHKGEFAEWITN